MLYKNTEIIEAATSYDDDVQVPETIADPITGEPAFKVVWKGEGYRGYYEVEPLEGCRWSKIEGNWVGGEWGDLPDENRSSVVQARIDKMAEERTLLIVIASSSNVFATMYDLFELSENGHAPAAPAAETYKVTRVYRDSDRRETIRTGLTLEEAQAHCKDPATKGDGWMDTYDDE